MRSYTAEMFANTENIQAFSSEYVYCLRKLGLDGEKVNVNGGEIALGHFVRATGLSSCYGACCVATLLHKMKRRGRNCRYGVISMCCA
ncbi:3-ketoacyl-CoA thiolase 1, peroxisomal-like [Magnolia sinica]|uniref:3-ketoacyl-CoA thiolase 1, peroxisomal-like n=1 Tax=Magnolia sinica TaxID=86752 RepID=UPI002658A152|nr:3-ketoacyl-CoA thiolase 1, peroxisomal-like [Magnolia sinica]